MSFLTILLSPLNLLFFIVIAGFSIGKIRIKGVSVGIAGILFAAILVGFLMKRLIQQENFEIITNAQITLKTFSKLGTSLFVSVIGLQTGFSIKNNSKSSLISFAIGALMSMAGVLVTLLISMLDKTISYPTLLGILCGALTSTPGLSSVCELIGNNSKEAVWGYGCSYLLGVILVVSFTQLFPRKEPMRKTQMIPSKNNASKIYPELMLVCMVALLGNIIGSVKIALLNISLGITASTLTMGLIVGCYVNKRPVFKQLSNQCLNAFRNMGLALFFTETGFTTGTQSVAFEIKIVLYGALITLIAILCGWFLCRIASNQYHLHKEFIIAGGMTSSPAYGAIVSTVNESSTNCFSFAYFGALIVLVIVLQIIAR